ncbi:DNA/RNA non-specific endonuclease [Weissella viridescens]|uniref:DNA/RNA non-specific endonuclease n=1 Tax=Weissella viridescens TaxID=1629 RepID=UPI0022E8155A|nr:DNA/RNA non-specific endonuclease [Weissella viridescens]
MRSAMVTKNDNNTGLRKISCTVRPVCPDLKKLENEWAALKDGKKVKVKIKLKYPNAKTERPSSFKVTYTITDPKDPKAEPVQKIANYNN